MWFCMRAKWLGGGRTLLGIAPPLPDEDTVPNISGRDRRAWPASAECKRSAFSPFSSMTLAILPPAAAIVLRFAGTYFTHSQLLLTCAVSVLSPLFSSAPSTLCGSPAPARFGDNPTSSSILSTPWLQFFESRKSVRPVPSVLHYFIQYCTAVLYAVCHM